MAAVTLFHAANNFHWLRSALPSALYGTLSTDYLVHAFELCFREGQPASGIALFVPRLLRRLYEYGAETSAFYLPIAPLVSVFGKEPLPILLVNGLTYLLLTMLSIYGIGKRMGGEKVGLAAATLFSLYPMAFGASRAFVVESAVTAAAACAVWCLLASEGFSRRGASVLFGLACGWGAMIKYSFCLFAAGPLAWVLGGLLLRRGRPSSGRAWNAVLTAAAGSLIAGWHYFRPAMAAEYLSRPFYRAEPGGSFARHLKEYGSGLLQDQLGLLFFLAFLAALLALLFRDDGTEGRHKAILLLWIGIPVLALSAAAHPFGQRYLMPCLPAVALVSILGLRAALKKTAPRRILCGLLLAAGLAQCCWLSFGRSPVAAFGRAEWVTGGRLEGGHPYRRIAAALTERTSGASDKVLLLPYEYRYTDMDSWRLATWLETVPFRLTLLDNDRFVDAALGELEDSDLVFYSGAKDLTDADFADALVEMYRKDLRAHARTAQLAGLDAFIRSRFPEFRSRFRERARDFKRVAEMLPDERGNSVRIFQRMPRGGKGLP